MTKASTSRKSPDEYNKAMSLYSEGMKICDISRKLCINRSTISNWILGINGVSFGSDRKYGLGSKLSPNSNPIEYMKSLNSSISDRLRYCLYSYLLGLYLGDGHIARFERTKRISISLDARYGVLNTEVFNVFETLLGKKPSIIEKNNNGLFSSVDITLYSTNIGILFPQEGEGAKHLRTIKLRDWQREIIDYRSLLKGLIMSDGSFYIRKKTLRAIYNFTNCSKDIADLVCECLDRFNLQYNRRIHVPLNDKHHESHKIEVAHRASVEKMISLIGTKEVPVRIEEFEV